MYHFKRVLGKCVANEAQKQNEQDQRTFWIADKSHQLSVAP